MNFFEFASSWFLGILTVYLTNDSSEIVKCRMTLLDLENELEELGDNPHTRPVSWFGGKFKNIKNILKNLNVQHAGLFIKCVCLQKCIDESLKLISRWKSDYHAPENNVASISVELREIWGVSSSYTRDETDKEPKIKNIQNFLNAGFVKRICLCLCEMISVKNKS